jgi:hypothetical protein
MPQLVFPLSPDGLFVDVLVNLDAAALVPLRLQGGGPSPVKVAGFAAPAGILEREQMSPPAGKYYAVSYFRRLVIDLMYFSAQVPSVTLERRMDLARLIAARQACQPTPSWSAIFTKAYAMVAARMPELRTSYLKFPWPRFYEHPMSIATINIDRQLAQERVVLYAHIPTPENLTLAEIDSIIHRHQQEPVDCIASYRRAVQMSWVPWPFRKLVWWGALNVFGSLRCQNFGTFGITSLGSQGAGILKIVPLLTTTIHYGMFDPSGAVDMRVSFDHRVLDGTTAAQSLADLEGVLLSAILHECTGSA